MNFEWLEYLEHGIILLTFISPFLPPNVVAGLGVAGKAVKYLSGNFGHAKNANDK